MSYLHRLLLSPLLLPAFDSGTRGGELTLIFDRVLFPVLDELLKPQVFERDPAAMGETRLRAATLLCKIFLQYVVQLTEQGEGSSDIHNEIRVLFVRVVGIMERFVRSEREMLNEATESLKNVVLVMHQTSFLLPPMEPDTRTEDQRRLWESSAARIEKILPGFLNETMLPSQPPEQRKISA
jgi:brefeldin A-resistance guanine nucleotide exchange factor 1